MQLLLRILPGDTKIILKCLGEYENDSIIQYIANGLPVFSHGLRIFRVFLLSPVILLIRDYANPQKYYVVFCILIDSIRRYLTKFRKEGESAFFSEGKRKGYCHKSRYCARYIEKR